MSSIQCPRYLHTSDICVLELAAAADLTSPSISVVAVPPSLQQYEAGTLCTVAGWGTTTEGGNMAEVVMKVGTGRGNTGYVSCSLYNLSVSGWPHRWRCRW